MNRIIPGATLLLSLQIYSVLGDDIYQRGFLSKEEALKSIELPDGYALELVLSEPQVEEPVALAWDGNGVLYVVEMLTYMQTADATDEQAPRVASVDMKTPMETETTIRALSLSIIFFFRAWYFHWTIA